MKSAILIFAVAATLTASAQGTITPAPADKAVVYLVRTSAVAFAVTMPVYDSAAFIGNLGARKYIRYECEPGNHVLWATAENRDFINANLEAGKIYFAEVLPHMGIAFARVTVYPVDGKNPKQMKNILKLMSKKEAVNTSDGTVEKGQESNAAAIVRGMERYDSEKKKGKKNKQLTPEMNYVQ